MKIKIAYLVHVVETEPGLGIEFDNCDLPPYARGVLDHGMQLQALIY
jgi:hypothetical protein